MASKDICRIDAHINSLCDLQLDPDLISLNLHCNNIQRIENLSNLVHLKHLDLSSNHIERILGLDRLVSLRTLNLSCNQIQVVEGLAHLRNLTKLDLSYNMIDNLSGLKAVHGTSYSLTYLYLHGNQLTSLDHILNCLHGCTKLKEFTLEQHGEDNPVCVMSGYRSSLLTAMSRLEVLDGSDRSGMPATVLDGVQSVPGLDDYMSYLMSTDSSEQSQAESRYEVVTPRIDLVLNKYKQHRPLSTDTDQDREDGTIVQKTSQEPKQPAHMRLSADHEVRLETLEHQIANLLYKPEMQRVRPVNQPRKVSKDAASHSEESDTNEVHEATPRKRTAPQSTKTRRLQKTGKTSMSRKQRPKPSSKPSAPVESSSSTSPTTPSLMVQGKVVGHPAVRAPEDDASYLSLMQELDTERERRWKAEQAGRKLVDHIKEIHSKAKEDKQLQEAALAATARLKQALLRERQAKTAVQREVTELQTENKDLNEKRKKSRESEEEQQKALHAMEDVAAKLETRRIQEHAQEISQTQEHKMREAAACRETELLKHSVKQLKGQVHQLQELLASREQEHRKEKEGLVRADSKEVRDLLEKELIKQEARQEQVLRQYQDGLERRNTEYAALEDEFRMALQIEANRFRELQDVFERVSEETAENKQTLSTVTQKEKKASSMVTELTSMVKEQRGRITELSRGRQDQIAEYKERIQLLEKQLNDARRQLTRLEVLEQDKSKLAAQIRAQESVIEGLRTERKLWGQELAQQGASLAQDRGRLEARIESLTSEVQELRKQSQSDNDTIRIKTKLVEDQTDSIRNMKKALSEREKEEKTVREEREEREKELQDQLAAETATIQEMQEQIDALVERKEELKKQLRDAQEQLDSTHEAHRALKSKWQEKSELISRMEQEVVQMRDNFVTKEKKLTEERDKAIAAGNAAFEKLKTCDNAFRRQLEQQTAEHRRELETAGHEKDREVEQGHVRVLEVESEMRELLQENALTKKTVEMRIKKLTSAFHEIQQDLAT